MNKKKIRRILIANRGEIALRIKQACDRLKIQAVCVLSEADAKSSFARKFKETIIVGPAPAAQSYLNQELIIKAAKDKKCDAVHPGYGFLSENAEFAKKVIEAGLVFIGPSPESIQILGDKTRAREKVISNGVPCVPGSLGGLSDEEILKKGSEIGFPVVIKASAGGGGRGMRVAGNASELADLLPRARAEARKFFSNDDVFIEKFIISPRHVEVQLIGDMHGTVLHAGTRDCSAQRRHQKVIEEAPAPNLSEKLREAIHTAAVQAAKSVGYYNAGTAEFLVSGESFYFLEMNTRIQVEHPVTEEVTGLDLVSMQIAVAEGKPLSIKQKGVKFKGHALELRIYAENAEEDFRPSLGEITELSWAKNDIKVRKEFGFEKGDVITPYYDAMIGKVIVTGKDRLEAIENARKALAALSVAGIQSNVEFLEWLLLQPKFRKGEFSIQDIEMLWKKGSLDALRKRQIRDPHHTPPKGGKEHVEKTSYKSQKFNQMYSISILHRFDGTFVVIPALKNKKATSAEFMRRSNSCKTAVKSLCEDVLEKISPKKIFS